MAAALWKCAILYSAACQSPKGSRSLGVISIFLAPESLSALILSPVGLVTPAVVLAGIAFVVIVAWLRRREYPEGACQTCGYNLSGNVSGICPECGTPIPAPTPVAT